MKKSISSFILIVLTAAFTNAQSVIPNNGFESWTSMGSYNNPDSWTCLNDMTALTNTYTCFKGTPGNPGTAYLKLISKSVAGMGVIPGIAISGMLDMATFQPTSGFAFSDRPQSLTGKWQYMASGADQGFVAIVLTKWNSAMMMRDTIASAFQLLSGMEMSWASFSIDLTYVSGASPDSALIVLSSSGALPVANSYLYVDNLGFTGSVTGISATDLDSKISIFPNPTANNLMIDLSGLKDKKVSLGIFDVKGNQVKSFDGIQVSAKVSLDVADLSKGNYILKVNTSEGIISRSFVKQ